MSETEPTYDDARIAERLQALPARYHAGGRVVEVALWRPEARRALVGTPDTFVRSGDPR